MQLSKLENKAYEELRKNHLFLFKIKDLCLLLKISRTKAYNIVKALKKKEAVKKIGKFFAFKDSNELIIGSNINYPSYISFWSALSYYGFSDQTPRRIFLATTKYSKEIGNFKYVTLSRKRFFGYVSIGDITIAEKEKAIIDSLLFPKYSGGIREITKCIESALNQLDIRKLADYAVRVKSKVVLRRLGFILENTKKRKYLKDTLKKIRKNIGAGYELLEPNLERKNNYNSRWLLDVNC